jgi:hypothetical protein
MSRRVHVTGSSQPRIQIAGNAQPRVDPSQVAAALGAELIPTKVDAKGGPLTVYALRAELLRRRHSSGGRPGIAGASQRVKIPLSDRDWTELEKLAALLTESGFSPSPGQIASVLLHVAIRSVTHLNDDAANGGKLVDAIAQELAASGASEDRE